MAGQIDIRTFSGGMNKDADYSLLNENQYIDAQNFKLVANTDSNSLILENAEGNTIWLDLSTVTDGVTTLDDTYYLVGHAYTHPYLVLFYTTNNADRSPDAADTSAIVRIAVDKDHGQVADLIYVDGVSSTKLDFSTTYPIKAVAHYESNDNIKVYWTDGYNPVRGINIMDSNLATYTADMLELVPDFPTDTERFVRPQISALTQGDIQCGMVQYAYQYYIENGPATLFSPASALIPIPDRYSASSLHVAGGDAGENSGYGVKFTIDIPSTNLFNRIRIVALDYSAYNAVPTVRVISEQDVTISTEYDLNIVDTGELLTELLYENFLVQNNSVFAARDLEIKDNYLFAGNIREIEYDVDIDMRAYRHDSGGEAVIWDETVTADSSVTLTGVGKDYAYSAVPATHACINKYNKSNYGSTDDEEDNTYVFQADGTTWGAEGMNIKLSVDTGDVNDFSTYYQEIDDDGNTNDKGWTESNTTYQLRTRGFQRNEVYRIGVIFRDDKMRPSPVKWVCDLKMPAHYEDTNAFANTVDSSGTVRRQRIGVRARWNGNGSNGSTTWANTGAKSWELVMVPRESGDRSILAQGIWQKTHTDSSPDYYWPIHFMNNEDYTYSSGTISQSEDICRLISPEVSFNKNLEFQENDFVHYIGYFDGTQANTHTDATGINYDKVFNHTPAGSFHADYKEQIADAKVVGYTTDADYRISINGDSYGPYVEEIPASGDEEGSSTTHLAFALSDGSFGYTHSTANRVGLVNYKRDVFSSQYGGPGYYARQNNTYISISDLMVDNECDGEPFVHTWEGDTFIDWFFYQNACLYLDGSVMYDATQASAFIFPVETSIHLSYRLDDGIQRNINNLNAVLTQEIAGTWEGDVVDGTNRTWEQERALYQYNPVYSQLNKGGLYYPDDSGDDINVFYPTRIKRSELKSNGELIDSMSIFLPNNFIDLNGKHGPLSNLTVFNNSLFFWQNSGFGVASVNTRALVESNAPGILALGTGGILDRVDYISEIYGNQNSFGIAKSERGLYWIDSNKNQVLKYSGKSVDSLSKLKGIQTWINSNGRIGDVKAVYDSKYNDVIFTITFSRVMRCYYVSGDYFDQGLLVPGYGDSQTLATDGTRYNATIVGRYPANTIMSYNNVIYYNSALSGANDTKWVIDNVPYMDVSADIYVSVDQDPDLTYTVSYNELADSFVSFHSYTPGRYIELDSGYLSTNNYHDLYKHNYIWGNSYNMIMSNKCNYYGTEYDSEVTVVFNKDYSYTKVWDTLKWYTESVDSDGVNQFKDTFDTMTIYNDYQHTGDRDLYYKDGTVPATRPTEIVRRDRTFSTNIPRNIVYKDVSDNEDITDSNNWDEANEFKERIRDKYIVVNFTYDNSNNYTFSIPFVSAMYRKSVR